MNEYRRIVLKSGVRVVLVPILGTASVSVMSLYEVGSRYETDRLSGVAHFVEHMCFKGTKRRPSMTHMSRELDALGAEYNAYTDRDNTAFYIRLAADRLPEAVDLLEDMVHHSLNRAADMAAEKGVITEELKMYEDNPMIQVEEKMVEQLFPGPFGRLIGGTPKTVHSISRADLVGFVRSYYRPERTVVVIAGQFEEANAIKLIEDKYGRHKAASGAAGRTFRRYRPAKKSPGPQAVIVTKETEQVQLAIGLPAFALGDKRLAALNVMSNILGGGIMSSRLFISLREKHGLCYHVGTKPQANQDVGQLSIHSGLAKEHLKKALGLIAAECRKMKTANVTKEELQRAKDNLKGLITLSLENTANLSEYYGRQEILTKKLTTPEAKIGKLLAVTREEVRQVAQEVLQPDRLALALIGPYDKAAGERFAAQLVKI